MAGEGVRTGGPGSDFCDPAPTNSGRLCLWCRGIGVSLGRDTRPRYVLFPQRASHQASCVRTGDGEPDKYLKMAALADLWQVWMRCEQEGRGRRHDFRAEAKV
jgi:hypothetical protein